MRRPVDPPINITTEFGVPDPNSKFGKHTGVDYAKPVSSPVFAPHSGIVTDVGSYQYNGLVVQIFDGQYYHRMLHNSQVLVGIGQNVNEGDRVALSGATGQGVTGPHVHWDIATVKVPASFDQFIPPAAWLATPPPKPHGTASVIREVYVRTAPNTGAPLAGSMVLEPGNTFVYIDKVHGQQVNQNGVNTDIWYVSQFGHYVWSGNCKDI